jgi:hypothetical protein
MSKYNLTELLSEVQGGRIGTLNITAMDLERKMEELEGEGIKVNTFGGDDFGKTYIEYHVHPENRYDPDESFSIYDYKFGEDPTDLENEDVEYPFSIGGRSAAISSAKALLGSGQVSYRIDEGEAVDLAIEASQEKAGIEVDESFKSLAKKLDKQKGIDKDEAAKIAGSIAAKKAAGAGKGPTAKQKKRMSEGILKDVVLAIIKDTNATNPEVQMYIDSLTNDIKLNGKEAYANYEIDDYIEDFKNYVADKSLQEKQYAPEVVDRIEMVRKALYDTNNFDAKEIEAYIKSIVGDFERGDFEAYDDFKADDYVEDIKNYISDKSLREHFGRFLKDYQ